MANRFLLLALSLGVTSLALCQNVRLTNDFGGGYTSTYTLATGIPYTHAVLAECSIARGRQNEPAVAVDPRNALVLIGSSNDYCGVYAGSTTVFVPVVRSGWVITARKTEATPSRVRWCLVIPAMRPPYAALAKIRTSSSGDPVVAWDRHGRVFMGSESSDDPAGTKKTFGDEWVATLR